MPTVIQCLVSYIEPKYRYLHRLRDEELGVYEFLSDLFFYECRIEILAVQKDDVSPDFVVGGVAVQVFESNVHRAKDTATSASCEAVWLQGIRAFP
jgi:hypothetical protein